MNRIVILVASLALALGTTACHDQISEPTAPSMSGGPSLSETGIPDVLGLERGRLILPAAARVSDLEIPSADAINPRDYVCSASSPVFNWYNAEITHWLTAERALILRLNSYAASTLPTYEALYLREAGTKEYFGYNGEYTQILVKTGKDIRRFWDIESADIQLLAMHGDMLLDVDRVAAVYREVYGLSAAQSAAFAAIVVQTMQASRVANGGDHAWFSFNAFAASFGEPYPDKIIMGDGILAGYAAVGFSDVAAKAIYAHEFAHQVQFENGYLEREFATAPEEARYAELMADAMAAYFMTHSRGVSMNRKRVAEFLQAFFQIGDCSFTNPGHHGTPNQRMAAARFGFDLADSAQKQGHILSADAFHAGFVAAYPSLIAPDAP